MDLSGQSLVGAVAQKPFSNPANATFGTIQPLLFRDGSPATPELFPNSGLVWWMLLPNTTHFAVPGQLVSIELEHGLDYSADNPNRCLYQAVRASVERAGPDDAIEVFTVPDEEASTASDLVSRQGLLLSDHPPSNLALVRWRDQLYGPLRATSEAHDQRFSLSFGTLPNQPIKMFDNSTLDQLMNTHDRSYEAQVSLTDGRDSATNLKFCSYELIPGQIYASLLTRSTDSIVLESDDDVLRRAAKSVLTRKQRQQFTAQLELLSSAMTDSGPEVPVRAEEVVKRLQATVSTKSKASDELLAALLDSEVLELRIRDAIETETERHIENRAARLTSEIAGRIEQKRRELASITLRNERRESEMASSTRKAQEEQRLQLHEERKIHRKSIDDELNTIAEERETLEREKEFLASRVEAAASKLVKESDEVAADFLALVPILQKIGVFSEPSLTDSAAAIEAAPAPGPDPFVPGGHVTESTNAERDCPSELEFFDRFEQHTKDCGFVYRHIDLVSFHLSVKCFDITVLGGIAGTGKSSLPRLYSEALAGATPHRDGRFQQVGVAPSWIDSGDLIGRLNVLNSEFYPSESGLYPLLVNAHEESERRSSDSGVYVVCLDEMNLAHVEHYFSPFLQTLESPPRHRSIQCFSVEAANQSRFRRWSTLKLPASLRFVGTVNFDETTRPLSLRLLDRLNLIRLRPEGLADLDLTFDSPGESPTVPGPIVTVGKLASWRDVRHPSPEVAEVLDQLRDPLRRLGCPLSPRRYKAISLFLSSTPVELLSPMGALDLQIAQRLLPQVRSLWRSSEKEAFDDLQNLLEAHDHDFPESQKTLQERRDDLELSMGLR